MSFFCPNAAVDQALITSEFALDVALKAVDAVQSYMESLGEAAYNEWRTDYDNQTAGYDNIEGSTNMQRPRETSAVAPSANHYDEIPYTSHPFPQSHPCRLATVARLFGLAPAPIDSCRVLELGCSSGGNLIPMAVQLPKSKFVGLDASRVEIDHGHHVLDSVGLDTGMHNWRRPTSYRGFA